MSLLSSAGIHNFVSQYSKVRFKSECLHGFMLFRATPFQHWNQVFCHETGLAVLRVLALTRNTYKNPGKAGETKTGADKASDETFHRPGDLL